jgi:hypothetical protein
MRRHEENRESRKPKTEISSGAPGLLISAFGFLNFEILQWH